MARPLDPRNSTALLLVAILSGCTYDEPISDCSMDGQKAFVYSLMTDYYLWYDHVPDVDPADYDTPQALLDAMAYREKDRWSGMQPIAARRAYYDEARYIGLGFQIVRDGESYRLGLVYAYSPADEARLTRGTYLLAVNGVSVEEIEASSLWGSIFGPAEIGVPVELTVQGPQGDPETLTLVNDWVDIQSVHTTNVIELGESNAAYLLLTGFLSTTTVEQLHAAFAEFREQSVTDLVLDLRYNGGGLVSTSQLLGSLIAGEPHAGEAFVRPTYNDRHPELNRELVLGEVEDALGLDRLVVLTGSGTASASELLINGLRPFMPVTLVGDTTYGKAVGADTWVFCSQAITPITFWSLNGEDQGYFIDGFEPDCPVPDDLDHAFGDPEESRLRAALSWLQTGSCESASDDGGADTEDARRTKSLPSSSHHTPVRLVRHDSNDEFGCF